MDTSKERVLMELATRIQMTLPTGLGLGTGVLESMVATVAAQEEL